jgi:hypothetical protein
LPRRGSRVQVPSPAPVRPPAPAGLATAEWSAPQGTSGSPAKARYPSGKGEVCKTFMRRFDPGPRLQILNNLPQLKPEDTYSGCQYGCQLALQSSLASCWGSCGSRTSTAQLSTQGLGRQVRRFVQDMSVELEKNVGARVSKALLRRLDWHASFHHPRRPPVAEKTPSKMWKTELPRNRLNAPGEKIFVPDRSGLASVRKHPVVVLRPCAGLQG